MKLKEILSNYDLLEKSILILLIISVAVLFYMLIEFNSYSEVTANVKECCLCLQEKLNENT